MASKQMFHYLSIYQKICIILYMSIVLYSTDDKNTIIIRKIKLFPFLKVLNMASLFMLGFCAFMQIIFKMEMDQFKCN